MAFTYRKQVSIGAWSDGISKKLLFDFTKQINADMFAPNKISNVEVLQSGAQQQHYPNVLGSLGGVPTTIICDIDKVSIHGNALVEVEFVSAPHVTTDSNYVDGVESYGLVVIQLMLVFDLD